MINKLILFLDKSDKNKYYKFVYNLLLPISLIIEIICYKYYWNIILNELLTNDDMVEFFDVNEFGFKKNKIYKMDIVEKESYLDKFNLDELKLKIKQEIVDILDKKIKEITSFDLENYLNVLVLTDIKDGIKIYTVEIKYYRYFILINTFKKFMKIIFLKLFILLFIFLYLKYK